MSEPTSLSEKDRRLLTKCLVAVEGFIDTIKSVNDHLPRTTNPRLLSQLSELAAQIKARLDE